MMFFAGCRPVGCRSSARENAGSKRRRTSVRDSCSISDISTVGADED